MLLATGELRGHGASPVLHIERGEQFQCLRARRPIRDACEHRQQRYVVGDIEKRNQVWRLEYETDFVPSQGAQITDSPAIVVDHFIAQRHATTGRINHRA